MDIYICRMPYLAPVVLAVQVCWSLTQVNRGWELLRYERRLTVSIVCINVEITVLTKWSHFISINTITTVYHSDGPPPPQLNTHRRYSFCFNTLELSCTCISRALAYHKKQTPVSLFVGYLDLQRKTYVDIQHVQNDIIYCMFTCNRKLNKILHINMINLLIDMNFCILLGTGMQQFFWLVNIAITWVLHVLKFIL